MVSRAARTIRILVVFTAIRQLQMRAARWQPELGHRSTRRSTERWLFEPTLPAEPHTTRTLELTIRPSALTQTGDSSCVRALGRIAVWDRSIAPVRFNATGLSEEEAGSHYGGGETGRRPDAERPAGTEFVGDPSDDWRAEWRAPEPYADAKRHHSPAHGRLGRELHQAVGRVGEGQGGHADHDESAGEEPIAWRKGAESAAESEDAGSQQELAEPDLVTAGGYQGARHRAYRHDRRQEAELARVRVEDPDRHG